MNFSAKSKLFSNMSCHVILTCRFIEWNNMDGKLCRNKNNLAVQCPAAALQY